MTPRQLDALAAFLKARSGLIITPDKAYLLESRLSPIATKWKLADVGAVADRLHADRALAEAVMEAMTTNESSFFRDKTPFDLFTDVMLPTLLKKRAGQRRITIWSAASSSGQEAYSLAMLLRERAAELAGWRIDIIGCDISPEMVVRAKDGLYSHFEVQRGLPSKLLVKYFKQDNGSWRIDPSLREMVRFQTFNLLEEFTTLPTFDIIFCRNVLIYFDRATKAAVLSRMKQHLNPEGYLVLGGAETVLGVSEEFSPHATHQGLYQVKQAAVPNVA